MSQDSKDDWLFFSYLLRKKSDAYAAMGNELPYLILCMAMSNLAVMAAEVCSRDLLEAEKEAMREAVRQAREPK